MNFQCSLIFTIGCFETVLISTKLCGNFDMEFRTVRILSKYIELGGVGGWCPTFILITLVSHILYV